MYVGQTRRDLVVRGRIVCMSPLDTVSVRVDEGEIAELRYGNSGGQQPATGSARFGALVQLFTLFLPCARKALGANCSVAITAQGVNGQTRRENFVVAVGTGGAGIAKVTSGPIQSSVTLQGSKQPVMLRVERALVDPHGRTLIQGWATALSPIVTVELFREQDRLGVASLGVVRDDLPDFPPEYSDARRSGFVVRGELNPGVTASARLRLRAISLDGSSYEVLVPLEPSSSLSVQRTAGSLVETGNDPRRRIQFQCDELLLSPDGWLRLAGWAVCPAGIAAVSLQFDGSPIGDAQLGLVREDLAAEFPAVPLAKYAGFGLTRCVVPASPAGQRHRLHILIRNGMDDTISEAFEITAGEESVSAPPVTLPAVDQSTEMRLEVDKPAVSGDVVTETVTGRLTIEGWALALSGIRAIEVFLDGHSLGHAYYGTARRDVAEAFANWPGALRSGYIFSCPPRGLENGTHVVRLVALAENDETKSIDLRIDVKRAQDSDDDFATIRRRISQVEAEVYEDTLARLDWHPRFQLLLRLEALADAPKLLQTLAALERQVYPAWTMLVVTEDADALRALVPGQQDRVRFVSIDELDRAALLGGMPHALVGFLSPGDELGADALAEFAIDSGLHRGAAIFYADEDRISPVTKLREPFFKPAWSPDLLLSTNYIGRPWFVKASVMQGAGMTLGSALRGGEYDTILRCTELTSDIRRLSKLLCRRDASALETKAAECAALERAAARRGVAAAISATSVPGTYRFRRLAAATGKVSIIIPTCAAKDHIRTCIATLRAGTSYRNFEIICIDNIPDTLPREKAWLQENADIVVAIPEAFNWSRFNNQAALRATGEYLLFLNDDMEIVQPDWLDGLLEHAQRPEIGIVGPRLLYPDRRIQHAGIFLTRLGEARHAFRFLAEDDAGYFGLAATQRNVIAVTGACILVRRDVFDRLGGFDEAHAIINNDLDFGLRVHAAGLSVVYTPHVEVIHHELASRAELKDIYDVSLFSSQWRAQYAEGDPFFSPLLTKIHDDYRPDPEPVRPIYAGHPLFRRDDIQRILVVKLDHIGDMITALPAIRRLKQHFPDAEISLLAGRASAAFAATEPAVARIIEFDFFHARSALGKRELADEEWQELRAKLAAWRFDLAVDLRKNLETRDVLSYTGARYLAGYDQLGRFPWLDIALELEGAPALQRKRNHVSDDLVRLVDAIATACATDRTGLQLPPSAPEDRLNFLPSSVRRMFRRPVVAINPGVGEVMRQWPPEHFATLIDLLVCKNGVHIIVLGSPDEAALADEVLSHVVHRSGVVSLAGQTGRDQLPILLGACALYVGNNSGPKHIAAGLGVPTIGIHSGVVDATEWGPLGPRAVALQRNMNCSPCYLVKPQDCVRDVMCLKQLYPEVVHQYCEMLLARPVEESSVQARVKRVAKPVPVRAIGAAGVPP